MALSFAQTKVLIEQILATRPKAARKVLHTRLVKTKSSEPEFYDSVIKHGPEMKFSSDEWFDFFSKIPTRVLRDDRQLMNKLSESQRERLPPPTLG